MPNISTPKELGEEDKNDEMKKLLWVESVQTYHKRKTALSNNVRHVYSTILGQCSPTLQAKIKQHDEYENKTDVCDCGWLLK